MDLLSVQCKNGFIREWRKKGEMKTEFMLKVGKKNKR